MALFFIQERKKELGMEPDKSSSRGFAAGLKAARNGQSFLPLSRLPEEAEFGKLSKYILHHKPLDKVIFCPGVSHTVCSSAYSGAWVYSEARKAPRLYVKDSQFDGDYWMALRHVLGIKLSQYRLQLEDVQAKGICSDWVTKPVLNTNNQRVGVSYLVMDSRGVVKRHFVNWVIGKQAKIEAHAVKVREVYVQKCILFLEKTIEALDNPAALLTNHGDWMKGNPII